MDQETFEKGKKKIALMEKIIDYQRKLNGGVMRNPAQFIPETLTIVISPQAYSDMERKVICSMAEDFVKNIEQWNMRREDGRMNNIWLLKEKAEAELLELMEGEK